MKIISEQKFEAMFSSFQTNFAAAKLQMFYNMDNLREQLRGAAGALNEDSGVAYAGGLLSHINLTIAIAKEIVMSPLFQKMFSVPIESVLKVICLQHLSKMDMIEPNDDEYSAKKRGYPFKFKETSVYLKAGERSILNAMNNGVKFTDEEYEAMKIMDRDNDDRKVVASTLSLIVRNANEIAFAFERERFKKENI